MIHIEKFLTHLLAPTCLVWLVLLLAVAILLLQRRRRMALALFILSCVFAAASNTWVSASVLRALERPYRDIDPMNSGDFDAVVVLGGGTRDTPAGQVQLKASGDRVMLAARLYHANRTPLLICTGERWQRQVAGRRGPAIQASRILQDVGVSSNHVIELGGRNTREEMVQLQELVSKHGWRRVGVITSAWHMRRALRLAAKAGLNLEPLPANYEGVFPPLTAHSLLPTGRALRKTDLAAKEILARCVGR